MFAAAGIRAGDGDVYVAGGMESMNQAPFLLRKARFGYRLGDGTLEDAAVLDGLWCSVEDCHMGTHAERVAIRAGVSREDQDAFALREPPQGGRGDRRRPLRRGDGAGHDPRREGPRDGGGRRREPPARLHARGAGPARAGVRPARRRGPRVGDASGRSRPATRPGITDGAAATVVVSERAVERYGLLPLARIVGYAQAEVTPRWLFLAPITGVRNLEARTGLGPEAFDLVEINEAFAAQVLADGRELGFDWSKVNVNGGAIALGHPIGASRRADRRDAAPRARPARAAGTASRRCASAVAGRSRWPSNGSDGVPRPYPRTSAAAHRRDR